MQDLKLDDVYIDAVKETHFKHLMDIPITLRCKRTFLLTIIFRWDDERSVFHLGGKLLPILP